MDTSSRLTTRPLHPLFGLKAIVDDLSACTPDIIAELDRLIGMAGLLLIRDARLDEAGLARLARSFGTLQNLTGTNADAPDIFRVSNLAQDGTLRAPDDKARARHEANKLWHTDSSFMTPGASYSFLHAWVVPEDGKDTLFCDGRVAWDALEPNRQTELRPLVALHSMQHSWRRVGVTMPDLDFMEPVARKLVRRHQPSGRDTLVIPSHVERIVGLSGQRSLDLIEELTALASVPQRVYRHHWRAGDLLVWDNRCMLHRASRSGADDQPRDLRTCRLVDTEDDGLADMPAAA